MNLQEFTDAYITPGRIVAEVDAANKIPDPDGGQDLSPFIIIRWKGRTFILNPMILGEGQNGEHLCVDVHAFIDGEDAMTGVFGMSNGMRSQFPKGECPGTSHGWGAHNLIALMLGEQVTKETDDLTHPWGPV